VNIRPTAINQSVVVVAAIVIIEGTSQKYQNDKNGFVSYVNEHDGPFMLARTLNR